MCTRETFSLKKKKKKTNLKEPMPAAAEISLCSIHLQPSLVCRYELGLHKTQTKWRRCHSSGKKLQCYNCSGEESPEPWRVNDQVRQPGERETATDALAPRQLRSPSCFVNKLPYSPWFRTLFPLHNKHMHRHKKITELSRFFSTQHQ